MGQRHPNKKKIRMIMSSVSINAIDKCINQLSAAFLWDESPQGFDYWSDVHDRLLEIRQIYIQNHTSQNPNRAKIVS
jgi:hypothetical protein